MDVFTAWRSGPGLLPHSAGTVAQFGTAIQRIPRPAAGDALDRPDLLSCTLAVATAEVNTGIGLNRTCPSSTHC